MSSLKSVILRAGVIAGLALSANQAYADCTFETSGEPSLQGVFNVLLGPASVDVETTCIDDGADAAWSTVGSTGTIQILIELAANRRSNTFGIYDLANGNQIRIFEGNDGLGVRGTVELSQSGGQWWVRVKDTHASGTGEGTGWGQSIGLSSSAFGFYLGAAGGPFFSDTALNSDDVDHMYAYGPLAGPVFGGQYIIAWEDQLNGGDSDYQDFVATLRSITPVPLPTAVWLLASGLIGLAGVARRDA